MTTLGQHADQYLQLRRALGHKMNHAAWLLPRFIACLEATGTEVVTIEAALAWAQSSAHDPAPASRGVPGAAVGRDPRFCSLPGQCRPSYRGATTEPLAVSEPETPTVYLLAR